MHDIRLIRDNPEAFDAALARRGVEPQSKQILEVDAGARTAQTELDKVLASRNEISKEIGIWISKGEHERAADAKRYVEGIKQKLPELEEVSKRFFAQVKAYLGAIPNLPAADVPNGKDESENVELSRWGTPREFAFTPKEHADIGPALGLDFETGALISGARFTFLRGQMARLQRALGQFMLDQQTIENGYIECAPPLLVKDAAVFGTGQLPKFAEDLFQSSLRSLPAEFLFQFAERMQKERGHHSSSIMIKGDDIEFFEQLDVNFQAEARRWLIPTAEVSLTNSVREAILSEAALPLRLTALTPCFRSEAGAAGKDTRGYIRQHQFEKVELVSITRPEDSAAEHERMTAAAESVLQALELPYRKVLLCAGDMGFTAQKTYDLEVWLPGQNAYREISSCSNCGAFQARRMNARYRPEGGKGTEFIHTLNGSGLAVGRTLVAVLENYQQEDGSVTIPSALLPYMGGLTQLSPA